MSKLKVSKLDLPEELKVYEREVGDFFSTLFKGPKGKRWKDHTFIPAFEPDTVQFFNEEWDGLKSDDVIIASYPKTGEYKLFSAIIIIYIRPLMFKCSFV